LEDEEDVWGALARRESEVVKDGDKIELWEADIEQSEGDLHNFQRPTILHSARGGQEKL